MGLSAAQRAIGTIVSMLFPSRPAAKNKKRLKTLIASSTIFAADFCKRNVQQQFSHNGKHESWQQRHHEFDAMLDHIFSLMSVIVQGLRMKCVHAAESVHPASCAL